MVLKLTFAVVVVLLLTFSFAFWRKTTPHEAEQLAEAELALYCAKEGLRRTDFGGITISPEEKYDWSAECQSYTTPQHTLLIYIKWGKIVEQHRLIE